MGSSHKIVFNREIVKLYDGGQIALDWSNPLKVSEFSKDDPLTEKFCHYNPPDDRKVMIMVHGLTGGSNTGYV